MYFIEKRDLIVLFFMARGCVFISTKMKMMKLFREYLVKKNTDNQHARIN